MMRLRPLHTGYNTTRETEKRLRLQAYFLDECHCRIKVVADVNGVGFDSPLVRILQNALTIAAFHALPVA